MTQNDGSDDDDADDDDGGEDNDDGDEEEQSWKTKPRNYVVWHDYDNDGDGGDDDDDKKQRLEEKKTKTGMMSFDRNTDETSKWANLQKTRNDNFWHNMQQRRLSLLENFSANN